MRLEMMGWLHIKTHADLVVLMVTVLMVLHHVLVRVMECGVEVVQHVIEVSFTLLCTRQMFHPICSLHYIMISLGSSHRFMHC